jgi:hypothetical protein
MPGLCLDDRVFSALLLQRVRNVREGGEVGADSLYRKDNRDRNAGGDQTVFDRRRAVFVAEEITKVSHGGLQRLCCLPCLYIR